MRPVRLTFAGLRSYRSETTIDFTDLDLFAVIGDTGAGKSTLIEALCLALYAKKSWTGGESGLSDMITDGVNTMRIELTFVAGGDEWTVTRARHRNSSAPIDKLVSATAVGADGAKAVTERITELIGLNYAQFTRAVVLPQGRFDSLLRASEKERNQILTSILDLGDIVATRNRVDALAREWAPKVTRWVAQREQLPADAAAEAERAEGRLAAAVERVERLSAAVAEADRIGSTIGELAERRRSLGDVLAAPVAVEAGVVGELSRLCSLWDQLAVESASASERLAAADGRLAELQLAAESTLGGFADRDALVAAATGVRRVVDELPEALATRDQAYDRVETLMKEPPAIEVPDHLVEAAVVAEAALDAATSAVRAAEQRLAHGRTAWLAHADAVARVQTAREALAVVEQRVERGEAVVAESAVAVEAAEQAVAAARTEEHAALVADAAATAAVGCEVGDDCPVCARPLPEGFVPPLAATGVEAARSARAAAEAALRHAQAAANELGAKLAGLAADVGHRRDEAVAAEAVVAIALDTVNDLGLSTDAPSIDEAVAPLVAALSDSSAAHEAARAAEREAAKALAAGQAAAESAVAAHARDVASARDALASAEQAVGRLRALVDAAPDVWREGGNDGDDLVGAARVVLERMTRAVASLQSTEADRVDQVSARLAAASLVAELQRRIVDDVERPVAEHVRRVAERLRWIERVAAAAGPAAALLDASSSAALALPTLGVDKVVEPVGDPAALELRAAAVGLALESAEAVEAGATALLDDLDERAATAGAALASVLAGAGCDSAAMLQHEHGAAGAERGIAEAALAAARDAAARAASLDEILAVARPFAANLAVLNVALRDQHFIAHLVDAREQELLAEAARRLKEITKGRFGFVADFGVVDIASGEVRSPDTLSGGERFQAALALALALVEIASRGGGRLDAVFVDEGFGSLDSNALDVALDTLGLVAGDGKMVALISHLRPVAEFVDTVLLVTKDDMFGSRIELLDADARDEMLADDIRSGLTA